MSLPPVQEGQPHVGAHNLERQVINSLRDLSDETFLTNLQNLINSYLEDLEPGGGSTDISGKLDIGGVLTEASSMPIFWRDIQYDLNDSATPAPPISVIAVNGVVRFAAMPWGFHEFHAFDDDGHTPPGTRYVIGKDAAVGTGNFTELVDARLQDGDEPSTPPRTVYARKWQDGSLIRNDLPFIDVYYHDGLIGTVPFDLLPNPCLIVAGNPIIEVG